MHILLFFESLKSSSFLPYQTFIPQSPSSLIYIKCWTKNSHFSTNKIVELTTSNTTIYYKPLVFQVQIEGISAVIVIVCASTWAVVQLSATLVPARYQRVYSAQGSIIISTNFYFYCKFINDDENIYKQTNKQTNICYCMKRICYCAQCNIIAFA